jgi:hypothetical protein
MTDPDNRTPQEKFAELDALSAEQDRQFEERMRDLQAKAAADPRVQLGVLARVRDMIAEVSADVAWSVGSVNAGEVHRLALRLVELGLLDFDADPVDEVEIGAINDLATGEMVTAICPDGEHTYWKHGRQLIVHREHGGRLQYARVNDDGSFGPWADAPPPPSQSRNN